MPKKGLNNNGNTCFMNSGLQMLLDNTELCSLIIRNKNASPNITTMANFIKKYYDNSDSDSINPYAVKEFIETKYSRFRGTDQHDAGEFIINLLELLDIDLKNKLDKLYEIEIKNTTKCKFMDCLTKTYAIEKTNILILPLNDEYKTLDDCYRGFKIHETLSDPDNKYFCKSEKCNKPTIASKKVEITNWSNNLIIMLKRFNYNNNSSSKNNQDIEIPFEWRHNFKIKGAVVHSGSTNGGHYIYISKNDVNNNWDICDDSTIRSMTNEQAENRLRKAYIIYYSQN